MVKNSQYGYNANNLHEILNEENELNLKKYFDKNKDLIIKDVENVNSLNINFSEGRINIFDLISPFYNAFIDNKNSFFYLLNNYDYNFEKFLGHLLKNRKFVIFNKEFYNKLSKINVNFYDINILIIYPSIFNFEYTSKYLLNITLKHADDSFIKYFLKNIVSSLSIKICKEFIYRRPYFMKCKIDYDLCYELLNILKYDISNNYYDYNEKENFRKRDYNTFLMFELILPYIKYNIESHAISDIINSQINSIVIKHNAVDYFNLMTKHGINFNIDYIDDKDFPVLGDCLKYGNTRTLQYLINNDVKILQDTYFSPEDDLIDCSFFNFNYKISEMFLNYISCKIANDNNLCIQYLIKKETIISYIKTICSNYLKKKKNSCSYFYTNNKYNKIIKSSLKKQINILYNFLDNDNNYNEYNRRYKSNYLKYMLNFLVIELSSDNISLDFLKKYNLSLLDINLIMKNVNIFENKNFNFFIDKLSTDNLIYDFEINISSCSCRCRLKKILNILKEKEITIENSNNLFNNEANRTIVSFLENCYNCKDCKNENNLEFIVEFFKKYYLKDNYFICDRTILINYHLHYLENFYKKTGYKLEDLYRQYFLNGFNYYYLFQNPDERTNYYYNNIDYKNLVDGLKMDNIKLLKPLYAISIINYNIKKFIQKRKENNLACFFNNINKINNEFRFSPNENTNKINKFIGIEFKKQINKLFIKNPVHIKPEHCVKDIHLTHKYITEKADGLTERKNIRDISDLNFNFIVEYENMGNVNIVFNINNGENVFENMMYLRNLHPFVPRIDKFYFNKENLEHFKKLEKEAFDEYIKNASGKLWWPKFIWIIKEDNLVDYLKAINDLTPLNIFKTDGYILYSSNQVEDIIKIKPFDLLTIDLKYNNGWYTKENTLFTENIISNEEPINSNIYRIYYDKETKIYYSREQRKDKKNANNNEIVNYLVKCHKSQWTIKNIINNLLLNNYYQINNTHGSYLKNIIKKYSFKDVNFIKGKVLDLGCGYKQTYLRNNKVNSLLGLDIDVSVILKKNDYVNSKNISFGLYDFSLTYEEQYSKFGELYNYFDSNKKDKFDTIIMLNTIHNCFPNNLDNLKTNINKFAKNGSIIVIRYLDKDLLYKNFTEDFIDLNNFGYIRKKNSNQINIYFDWCHKKQHDEYLVCKNDIIKILDNYEIIFEENKTIDTNLPNIERYFNCFKTIVFRGII